jgi:hypothetical protein
MFLHRDAPQSSKPSRQANGNEDYPHAPSVVSLSNLSKESLHARRQQTIDGNEAVSITTCRSGKSDPESLQGRRFVLQHGEDGLVDNTVARLEEANTQSSAPDDMNEGKVGPNMKIDAPDNVKMVDGRDNQISRGEGEDMSCPMKQAEANAFSQVLPEVRQVNEQKGSEIFDMVRQADKVAIAACVERYMDMVRSRACDSSPAALLELALHYSVEDRLNGRMCGVVLL